MTVPGSTKKEVRAKLFANGRSQAVRLPKEFRFEGSEVRIRRGFNGAVVLEPIAPEERPWKTAAEWLEHIAAAGGDPIFPNGREQPMEYDERDWHLFDEK